MIETQNMNMAKILLLVLVIPLMMLLPNSAAAAPAPDITVKVEGKVLEMSVPPAIVDGRTLVGVRFVGEAVGGEVVWNAEKRQATITRRSDVVVLTLGETEALVNGKPVAMDVPPQLISDRTMVPLRFIAEVLGGTVEWDEATRTANILRKPTAITALTYSRDVGQATVTLQFSEPLDRIEPVPVQTDRHSVRLDLYPAVIATDKPVLVPLDPLMRSALLTAAGRTIRLVIDLWHPPVYHQVLSPDGMTLTLVFDYTITEIQHVADGRIAQVNIASTGKLNYSTLSLANPARFVFDVAGTLLAKEIPGTMEVGGTPVSRIRSAQFSQNPDVARIVLDLTGPQSPEVISIDLGIQVRFIPQLETVKTTLLQGKTRLSFPFSLPVDAIVVPNPEKKQIQIHIPQGRSLMPERTVKIEDGTINTITTQQGPVKNSMVITVTLPYYLGHTVVSRQGDATVAIDLVTSPVYGKRIWIDAGHGKIPGGADDPGTIGPAYKTKEKLVNLAVALELQKRLEAAGATVFMTRTTDQGIDFTERPKLVNSQKPPIDIFVSIHHNSTTNAAARGIETYYWTTNPKSRVLAEKVHPQVVKALGFPDRKVRTESFVVIKDTLAPSILVELGYLSNAAEEKAIAEPGVAAKTYPARAASGIQGGIFDYFWQEIRSRTAN